MKGERSVIVEDKGLEARHARRDGLARMTSRDRGCPISGLLHTHLTTTMLRETPISLVL